MIHSRSVFALWLSMVIVFLPSLAAELLRPFNTAYTFLFAPLIGLILYGLFRLFCQLCNNQPFPKLTEKYLGHRGFLIVFTFYFLLISLLAALFIEDFGTRIVHSLMLHSDARFYNMTLLIISAFFARSGIRTIGRMAEILCPIFSGLMLFLLLPVLFSTPLSELFPFPSEAFYQLLPGSLMLSVLLGAGSILFVCGEELQLTPHSKKQCLYTAIFAAVYALLLPLFTTLLLGRYLSAETSSTLFLGLRQFKLFGVFGNTHILLMLPWMMLALITCSCFLWGLSEILKHLFKRFSAAFRQLLSPLTVLIILAVRNEWNTYPSLSLWIGVLPLGFLLFYGLPLGLKLLDRRKSKQPSQDG